jgi:hypothetical protein
MSVLWLDQVDPAEVGKHVRADGQHFTPLDVADMRAALSGHPWRELVVSVHRSKNAAKVARGRHRHAPRWSTPGLSLHTRKVGDHTAVVAKWTPTDRGTA